MKTVLITGANKGIGLELVKIFLKENWEVNALSRSNDNLKKLKEELNTDQLNIIQADLTKEIKDLLPADYTLDILINNAGTLVNAGFLDTSHEDWLACFDVNIFGPAKLIKSTFPNLNRSASPHIVNISSMGGFMGASKFAGLSAYSSSKSALVTLTECLAVEFNKYNISCNCLCLGAVNTEMLASAFPGYKAPVNADNMAEFIYYFSVNGHTFFNGKILPVALSNPE